jgi:hypothetical protein
MGLQNQCNVDKKCDKLNQVNLISNHKASKTPLNQKNRSFLIGCVAGTGLYIVTDFQYST